MNASQGISAASRKSARSSGAEATLASQWTHGASTTKARVQPVSIDALCDTFGFGPDSKEREVLLAAGSKKGTITAKQLQAYLAAPADGRVLSNSAIQAVRKAFAGLLAEHSEDGVPVDAFQAEWQRTVAGHADGDGNWVVTPAELDLYFQGVKEPGEGQEAPAVWTPDQWVAALCSKISLQTGERDLLAVEGNPDRLLLKRYMRIYFDEEKRIPTAVTYVLSSADIAEKPESVERAHSFTPDPELASSPKTNDYRRTGYDRGHNKPARYSPDTEASKESNQLSNVKPQTPSMNQKDMRILEAMVLELVSERGGEAVIVDASDFADADGNDLPKGQEVWIGENGEARIAVPTDNLKAVLWMRPDGVPEMYAWNLKNGLNSDAPRTRIRESLRQNQISVDAMERQVGQDFFAALPDRVEKDLEDDVVPFPLH